MVVILLGCLAGVCEWHCGQLFAYRDAAWAGITQPRVSRACQVCLGCAQQPQAAQKLGALLQSRVPTSGAAEWCCEDLADAEMIRKPSSGCT